MLCARCNHATIYPDGILRCDEQKMTTSIEVTKCSLFDEGKFKMYQVPEAPQEKVKSKK